MADVRYTVSVDSSGAVTAVQKLDDSFKTLGRGQMDTASKTGVLGDTFGKLFPAMTAANIAADVLRKGFSFLKNQFTETIAAASEAERIDRALESALQITGRAAEGTGQHFKNFAKELQRETIYGDEAIKKTQTLLIQLTRLDREGLDKATKGTIGLASVLGVDLQNAATLVAKAMEGNYTALARYGIKVNENLTASEKQAWFMEKLSTFYKRAQDDANTFSGRIAQLKEVFQDLQETIGNVIVGNKLLADSLNSVKYIIEYVDEKFQSINKNAKFFGFIIESVVGNALRDLQIAGAFAKQDLDKLAEAEKRGAKNAEELWRAAVKAGDSLKIFGLNIGPVVQWLNQLSKEGGGLSTLDEKLEKLGIKSLPQMREELAMAEAALREFTASGESAPGIVDALEKKIAALRAQLYGVVQTFGQFTQQVVRAQKELPVPIVIPIRILTDKLPPIHKFTDDILKSAPKMTAVFKKAWAEIAKAANDAMEKIVPYADQLFGALDAVISQSQRNKEIAIENEYKKRLAYINAHIKDETKRQQAIQALEAEYQIKRSAAARASAKQAKAVAMMEAIVNTAQAVTKALTAGPFIGPILAAMIGALGAVQIALIAKQPIPLAKGAVFSKPTLLAGPTYQVAENEPEFVAPKSAFKAAVREVMGEVFPRARLAFAGAGASVTVNMHAPLISSSGIARKDLEAAGTELLRQVNRQLRRVGRKA